MVIATIYISDWVKSITLLASDYFPAGKTDAKIYFGGEKNCKEVIFKKILE